MIQEAALKKVHKKIMKAAIYLGVAAVLLGLVIFISRWEKTRDGSMTWYYILTIFFIIISLIRLLLAIAERNLLLNPGKYLRK